MHPQVRIAYYDLGDAKAENTVILTHGMSGWSCVGMGPTVLLREST